jgi:hypothetical protein
MRSLCGGLMGAAPKRPRDDVGGIDAPLRQTLGYAPDFLERPADEIGRFLSAPRSVFWGAGWFA